MTTLSLKTVMAALLAGSLAATAGAPAFARGDGMSPDPAKFQERIEKRVDKALNGTDATQDQKKQITGILQAAFKDMKSLHDKRAENRKAMRAAMEAATIDPAKIEQIRQDQMKVADESSKRFTKALIDAGNVLNAQQRQAFFKTWGDHPWGEHRGHKKG